MPEAAETGTGSATVEQLHAALEREQARAREVDHRAKNSLQLVSSLLLLLSRRSVEPEAQQALKAMHQRVGAIAAVHREILGAERPDRFDLTSFVREHVSNLTRAHGDGAVVRLELDPVEVPSGKACPLALIVNELTLNALIHGAAGREPAQVKVALHRAGEGFRLSVEDDGPGFAADAARTGFGLHMVRLLTQQIGGSVAWENAQPGARAVVSAS